MQETVVENKPSMRIGDMPAILRLMGPLHGPVPDPAESRRRLVADLCRFIGVQIGMLPAAAIHGGATDSSAEPVPSVTARQAPSHPVPLSPRLAQTLHLLLEGDSEKQVAIKMKLSRHTVHKYVKTIYRRYDVQSRAELLAWHFKRSG